MGSIQKQVRTLKNGKQSVSWIARWREPGTGKQPSKSFPKKGLAQAYLDEVEADLHRGEYIAQDAGKVTFREYGSAWLAGQTFSATTREAVTLRLERHAFPVLGDMPLNTIKPSTVQAWLRTMKGLATSTQRLVLVHVGAVLAAAVDDELLRKNPCKAESVTRPRVARQNLVPWEADRVEAVRSNLPERYRIVVTLGAGLGLRQGEIFGLGVEDFDFKRGKVTVRRQVKILSGRRVFGLPKYDKTREVPLPRSVADAVRTYVARFPARLVTLPWDDLDGAPTTVRLLVTNQAHGAVKRAQFNEIWKRALEASGTPATREHGCHMLRHVYASVLLHSGESVKALSAYLGHADPGFTLRVYTHLMEGSDERTRNAVDAMLSAAGVRTSTDSEASSQVSDS